MKILILNTLYHPYQVGGAEQSTQLLAEGLVEAGHDVAVGCTVPRGEATQETVGGVHVHYVGLKNVYWQFNEGEKPSGLKALWHAVDSYNPMMKSEVLSLIESERPDIVHTHNLGGFSVSAWAAAQKASVPVVHTARDYSLLCPGNMFRGGENCSSQCLRCRPFTIPRRTMSKKVSAVVGISQFVLDRHLSNGYFTDCKVQTVIHNPISLEESSFQQRRSCIQSFREDGPLQIGFMGQLSPMKGVRYMLRAVDNLQNERGRVQVRIAGTGDKSFVKSLKEEYASECLRFCGFVDPSEFLPTLDVLVVPSYWLEPFGRVIIEAYAYGTPVVASRVGGIPEIVDEGKTGWLFDPKKVSYLSKKLKYIRDNIKEVKCATKDVFEKAKRFNLQNHIEKYEKVYKRV